MLKYSKIVFLFLLLTATAAAGDDTDKNYDTNSKYYFGGRIGTWINNGGTIPETQVIDDNYQLKSSVSDVNVYLDMFFGTRLFHRSYLEFSIGTVNRGSVTIQDFYTNDIANLLVYNFMIQYKVYPNLFPNHKLEPYLAAGGGVHYARRSIQFTNKSDHKKKAEPKSALPWIYQFILRQAQYDKFFTPL